RRRAGGVGSGIARFSQTTDEAAPSRSTGAGFTFLTAFAGVPACGADVAGAASGCAAEVEASACAALDADPAAACCTAACAVAGGGGAGVVSAGGAVVSPPSAGGGVETVAPPPSAGSAAGAGSVEVEVLGSVVASVVVASVEAWLGIAEASSAERT